MSEQNPPSSVRIHESWKAVLKDEFAKPYFHQLKAFLVSEKQSGQVIYPPGKLIFNAFDSTPFDKVEVVIIGQDPYHGPGQAHGLCFSVQQGVATPPSLQNIYKELAQDIPGFTIPNHGNLSSWAAQGVLMLNATLTVRARTAGSHQKKGWEEFTDAAIRELNSRHEDLVFLLWGRYAQNKGAIIDRDRHHVLSAKHPSPFSAHSGFFGCRHFSQANDFLRMREKKEIDWQVL